MTSSSQAITATALNSSPLARCIVPIRTRPPSACGLSVSVERPPARPPSPRVGPSKVAASERTKTPTSSGRTPPSSTDREPLADEGDLARLVLEVRMTGSGPLNTEIVPARLSSYAVDVPDLPRQQPVGAAADLVRRPVVDLQRRDRPRTSTPSAFQENGCWKIRWPRSPAKNSAVRAVRPPAPRGSAAAATPRSCASSTTTKSNGVVRLRRDVRRQPPEHARPRS